MQHDLVTKREAAEILGVTPAAVHRMMDRGELPVAETIASEGRIVLHRFLRSDVERLRKERLHTEQLRRVSKARAKRLRTASTAGAKELRQPTANEVAQPDAEMQPCAKVNPTWTLGDRLAKARRVANLSSGTMARLLGLSRTTISNYEHGRSHPPADVVRRWSETTGVSVTWLLDINEPPSGSRGPTGTASPWPPPTV